jgi:hypothetical protein
MDMNMNEIFLTGCDSNTEWQLMWFLENFKKHNKKNYMVVADFGMSPDMLTKLKKQKYRILKVKSEAKGWFKKPRAMLDCSRLDSAKQVCWIDTDCEIRGDITGIFKYTTKGHLCMVEDRPWSKRRGNLGTWRNSGVVAFQGPPNILKAWADECIRHPVQGDQEVLHIMVGSDEIAKMGVFDFLPHTYNTLRLDYIDNIAVKNPLIIHHTGEKGNDVIRAQMKNEKS